MSYQGHDHLALTMQLSLQGKGPALLQSFSRGQLNGTATSSSSTFSFGGTTLRQTKDAQMVVLDDDGLSLVRSTETMLTNRSSGNIMPTWSQPDMSAALQSI